jgi:hypothetical protein
LWSKSNDRRPCTVCTSRPLPSYVLIEYRTRVIGARVVNSVP